MEKAVRTPYLSTESIHLLFSAQDISRSHGSWFIDTVHLLRASLKDKSLTNILSDVGINLDAINSGMNLADPAPHDRPPSAIIRMGNSRCLTPILIRVLRESAQEAARNQNQEISPPDIFATLIKQNKGNAAGVLRDYGKIDSSREKQILSAIQRRRLLMSSYFPN